MADFTSALYLGLRHGSSSLEPWEDFTTGKPGALSEPPEAGRITTALARLMGMERALLARSTLHAFWDLFGAIPGEPGAVYVDEGAYPIARWAAERARLSGASVRPFRHHDARAVESLLRRKRGSAPPWILTDGFCTGCGRIAPLELYAASAARHRGRLVVDDTQAMGILGKRLSSFPPFGLEGGGSLRARGLCGPNVLAVASLAKGFGAPLTVIAGASDAIEGLAAGDSRVHASPPSIPDLRAAAHAISLNRSQGNRIRARLAERVRQFRLGARRLGLPLGPSSFPMQSIRPTRGIDLPAVQRRLEELDVRTVLHEPACAREVRLGFLIQARHSAAAIDHALSSLRRVLVLRRHARPFAVRSRATRIALAGTRWN